MTVIEKYTEEFQDMVEQLERIRIKLDEIQEEAIEDYEAFFEERKINMEKIYREIAMGNVGEVLGCVKDTIYEFAHNLHVCPTEQDD